MQTEDFKIYTRDSKTNTMDTITIDTKTIDTNTIDTNTRGLKSVFADDGAIGIVVLVLASIFGALVTYIAFYVKKDKLRVWEQYKNVSQETVVEYLESTNVNLELVFYLLFAICVTVILFLIKDQLVRLRVSGKVAHYNELYRFYDDILTDLAKQLLFHQHSFDQDSAQAIYTGRAILNALAEKLTNVSIFLTGKKRICLYDARDELRTPLYVPISVIHEGVPIPPIKLRHIDKMLDSLVAKGSQFKQVSEDKLAA